MSKKKKILIGVLLITALIAVWRIYATYNIEPVDPMASDGRKSAESFNQYQLELQKKGEL